jgi:hypothetical protein
MLFGALVDIAGFEVVFLIVLGFLLIGLAMTFRIEEPRSTAQE